MPATLGKHTVAAVFLPPFVDYSPAEIFQPLYFGSHANPVKEKGCRPAARGTPAKGYSRTAQPTPRSTGRGLCCFDYSRAFRPSFAVFREAVLTLRVNSDCQYKSTSFSPCRKSSLPAGQLPPFVLF